MTKPLNDELAKQLVLQKGKEGARRLFNETYDASLIFAILEKIEDEANDFNGKARLAKTGLPVLKKSR